MEDELFNQQETPEQTATKKELERMSQDSVRVYNPTDKDFITRFDGNRFVVPAKSRDIGYGLGQAVHPRYVALKYAKEMYTYLVESKMLDVLNKENERRRASGNREMDKWMGGEGQVFGTAFITKEEENKLQLYSQLILGIEHEFGMDEIAEERQEPQRDSRVSDTMIMNMLLKRKPSSPSSTDDNSFDPSAVLPETNDSDPIITPTEQKEELLEQLSQ